MMDGETGLDSDEVDVWVATTQTAHLLPRYSSESAAAGMIVDEADEVEIENHTGKVYGCYLAFEEIVS